MATRGFDQRVSRLAQYRPFAEEGRALRAVLRDLVLVATAEAENAGVWDSLATLKEAIQTLWGVDVEVEELRDVREVLVDEGRARRTEGGLTVSADTLGELESTKEESANIRLAAFGEWEEWVRRSRPDLSDEEFSALVVDLTAWLDRIIARHGVEAALVIYPENPRAQAVFDEIEGLGFDFLPDRGRRVREVRESAFPAFVRAPTAAQRRFLVDRLDVAYFLTVLTLDPQASQLVRERVKGHRVYLDTNVLYAVLGLANPQEALSALRLLELTRELGYELAITPWTVEELRTSLRRARHRVGRVPLPRRELAHLLATASDEKSVVTAFWASYRDRGVKPKDFFDLAFRCFDVSHERGVRQDRSGDRRITLLCLVDPRNYFLDYDRDDPPPDGHERGSQEVDYRAVEIVRTRRECAHRLEPCRCGDTEREFNLRALHRRHRIRR